MPPSTPRNPQPLPMLSFTVKDLITVVSLAVSIALQWGVFGTRITVLEKEVALLEASSTNISSRTDALSESVWRIVATQQSLQQQLDTLNDRMDRLHPQSH